MCLSFTMLSKHPAFQALIVQDKTWPQYRSLAPNRSYARPLEQIAGDILENVMDDQFISHFCTGLHQIVQAQMYHFPKNIFADLDILGTHILRQAYQAPKPVAYLDEICSLIIDLHACFGCQSPIKFCYIHDFIYGFDWAKWVRQDIAQRYTIGPFNLQFLYYLKKRADELVNLINNNDKKYPSLNSNQKRNPFNFSRTAKAEIHLHQNLAATGHIPVTAWELNGCCDWTQDFQKIRLERAQELTVKDR